MLDFDGVIADSLEPTVLAANAVLEEHGFAHLASREAMLRLVESNWFEGLREAGVPQRTADAIDDRVAGVVRAGGLAPYAAMPGVIAHLAERHHVLIVTSNRSDIVEAFLAHWAITGVSEVLGCDKGQSKVHKIRDVVQRFAEADRAGPARSTQCAQEPPPGTAPTGTPRLRRPKAGSWATPWATSPRVARRA